MKRIFLYITVISAWVLPLIRAFNFIRSTTIYNADESADSDFWYRISQDTLCSYSFSLMIGVFLIWLLFKTRIRILIFPLIGSIIIPLYVIWRRPEEIFQFTPIMDPLLPAEYSLTIVFAALLIVWLHKKSRRIQYIIGMTIITPIWLAWTMILARQVTGLHVFLQSQNIITESDIPSFMMELLPSYRIFFPFHYLLEIIFPHLGIYGTASGALSTIALVINSIVCSVLIISVFRSIDKLISSKVNN